MAYTNLAGTNLGPLTTTWSAPDTCTLFMPPCSTCSEGFRAQSCNAANGGSPRDNTACWPPAKAGVASPAWPFVGWGFYSPGLACPSGYTSACTAVYGQRPDWQTEFSLYQGETAVGCCPPGFACANRNGNTCILTVAATSAVSTAHCDGTDVIDVTTHVFPDLVTVTPSTGGAQTTTRIMTLYAPMFQLNFRSSDLSPTASSTSSTASSSTIGPTETSRTDGGPGGLTTGAKAGIGAGVGVGAVAIVACVAALLWRRRRRQSYAEFAPPDNEIKDYGRVGETHEMPATVLVELPAQAGGNKYTSRNEGI